MTRFLLLPCLGALLLAPEAAHAQHRWETLLDQDGVRADLDLAHVTRAGEYPRVTLRWFAGGSDGLFTEEVQEVDCTVPRVRLLETLRYKRDADGDHLVAHAGITPAWTRYIETTVEGRVLTATCEALKRP